jgi:hypothetical protein
MTTGIFPSQEQQQPEETSPKQQQQPISSTTKSSSSKSKLEAFASFCVQNPNFFKFIFQCLLTGAILGFCMIQLSKGTEKDNALYWSGITSVMTWWMPSPSSGKNSSSEDSSES